LNRKIKVGAVSYLNTKPLLYGIEHHAISNEITLSLHYPAVLAEKLRNKELDIALLPVAAIAEIEHAEVVTNYGIAADGNVVSVALFSQVPIDQIEEVFLDYQSRTSVRLAQILLAKYWKKKVTYLQAHEHYITEIKGERAGVIIGDRALVHLNDFAYVYDLSLAWKQFTGLDFVFAAWVTNHALPAHFEASFNQANQLGISKIDEVLKTLNFPQYDLRTYFTENIKYHLDDNKRAGLAMFLYMLQKELI